MMLAFLLFFFWSSVQGKHKRVENAANCVIPVNIVGARLKHIIASRLSHDSVTLSIA
jgi:prolipoprotein diacylglyceryltransferase